MKDTYGYTPLSYELIELFRSGAPDFDAAEELIRRGADVNDQGDDQDENVLSEILMGYWWSSTADGTQEDCRNCMRDYKYCSGCEHNLNPNIGESMIKIIQFFLDHGFDVGRNGGTYGAQCLCALIFSSRDRYMIDATKLLLDARALNVSVDDIDVPGTPMHFVGEESCFADTCEENHYLGNIYEAMYQVYVASEAGKPYAGIDSFEAAIGKKILSVMADGDGDKPVFSEVDLPQSKHKNCFFCNLYLIFDGGYLICTKYASYWVDTVLPEKPLVDVSPVFSAILGHTIQQVTFGHHSVVKGTTHYGQPITTFHMDNGVKLTFTINFGEVEKPDYCSYFYFGDQA